MSARENLAHTSFTLPSKHGDRPFLADATFVQDKQAKPVVLFHHGFKGFKDWGPFNLVAEAFAKAGFVFIKMNFSRNGTTTDHPEDFVDLEAFSQNNFSIELDDSDVLITHLFNHLLPLPPEECDLERFFLIGHSRGGAVAILKAGEDSRVRKVTTWAAVADLKAWAENQDLEEWEKRGVIYVPNSRTNQEMPLDYQIVEDFMRHRGRLDVSRILPALSIPVMALHGSEDKTVPVQAALMLKQLNSAVQIEIIEGADHTFGATHPYSKEYLPDHFALVVEHTTSFLKES